MSAAVSYGPYQRYPDAYPLPPPPPTYGYKYRVYDVHSDHLSEWFDADVLFFTEPDCRQKAQLLERRVYEMGDIAQVIIIKTEMKFVEFIAGSQDF